jgi:lycopene cyclase CruA
LSFPHTRERLNAETLAHIAELEKNFGGRRVPGFSDGKAPDAGAKPDFDVVLAGGGLSLIYAAYLARAGLRVCVFDRREIGCGHREWNISRAELRPLVDSGLFSQEECAALLLAEYDRGIVRWHGGGTHEVRGVLDGVIDAAGLLTALKTRAENAGATLLPRHALAGYSVGKGGVEVRLDGATRSVSARLLVDGLGASSPHAAYDLACPTVGGVLRGLDTGVGDPLAVDARTGEILISTEDVEDNRQHIWEGFPGARGEFTTYLFYYAEPHTIGDHPLMSLYERFFTTLPRYKRGHAIVEKPTYGFIPAYTRLRPMPVSPRDRVVLVGDAAGRHSPLTFCGFGSMIRSFKPVADRLLAALADDELSTRSLRRAVVEPPALAVMGGLTLMMVGRRRDVPPAAVNQLLDSAFATLAEMGNDTYAAFVRDEIGFSDFVAFMQRTAEKRPQIYDEVFATLTAGELFRWVGRLGGLGFKRWK